MSLFFAVDASPRPQLSGFPLLTVTYHAIDGHVENSPGPHNIEQAVDVLEDGNHHLILVFGSGSVDGRVQNVRYAEGAWAWYGFIFITYLCLFILMRVWSHSKLHLKLDILKFPFEHKQTCSCCRIRLKSFHKWKAIPQSNIQICNFYNINNIGFPLLLQTASDLLY